MKKSIGVILVLIIVLLLGVIGAGGYFLIKGNNDTNKEIGELKNQVANLGKSTENASNSQITNNVQTNTTNTVQTTNSSDIVSTTTKTCSTVKGVYEGKIQPNEWGDTATLVLCEDGTYGYYPYNSVDSHNIGYYTIKDSVLELYEIAGFGNDVSLTVNDTTKKISYTLNADGTITEKNNNIVYTKKTDIPSKEYDIAKSIKDHLKNGYLY